MSVQRQFNDFNGRIKLSRTDDVYTEARLKDDSITDAIKTAFAEEGYPVIDSFLQGSLSTDTGVLKKDGDFDIDRAIIIDQGKAPENPLEPKKIILNVLEKRGFKNIKIKKPCITADYARENLHIDFTVYRRDSVNNYQLAVGKYHSDENSREWSASDPKGLKKWIKDNSTYGYSAEKKQAQFNRTVRYIKRWRDETFSEEMCAKIFSIALVVMIKENFEPCLDSEGIPNDLVALKNTVNRILVRNYFVYSSADRYYVKVMLPTLPFIDIFTGSGTNRGTQLRNKLNTLNDKLVLASEEADLVKQCKILNGIFGDDFHVPDAKNNLAENVRRTIYSTAGSVGTSQGA